MEVKLQKPAFFVAVLEQGRLTYGDIRVMQRMIYVDGAVSREAASWLIAIHAMTGDTSRTFAELYVEVLTDFVVYRDGSTGIVSDEQATWLLDLMSKRRNPVSALECELIESICAEATRSSPIPRRFLDRNRASEPARNTIIEASTLFAASC